MTLWELAYITEQPLIVIDSMTGKVVFKRYEIQNPKGKMFEHYKKYADCEIRTIWSELVAEKSIGFGNYAHSVIKCYVSHADLERVRQADGTE